MVLENSTMSSETFFTPGGQQQPNQNKTKRYRETHQTPFKYQSTMAITKLLTFVALTVLVASMATGQIISSNCCPSNVSVVPNFDVSKYLGTWYEYAKYPVYFEGDGVCITAQYSLQNDGNVAVKNTQVNGTTGTAEEILGTASVVSNAKLLVKFPVSPSYEVSSNYWILQTDYCNYSVVYSCQELPSGQSSTIVWILTRQRLPSENVIETALSVLKQNNISLDPLTVTNQVACV